MESNKGTAVRFCYFEFIENNETALIHSHIFLVGTFLIRVVHTDPRFYKFKGPVGISEFTMGN